MDTIVILISLSLKLLGFLLFLLLCAQIILIALHDIFSKRKFTHCFERPNFYFSRNIKYLLWQYLHVLLKKTPFFILKMIFHFLFPLSLTFFINWRSTTSNCHFSCTLQSCCAELFDWQCFFQTLDPEHQGKRKLFRSDGKGNCLDFVPSRQLRNDKLESM